ncbi:YgfZ/GcvT domain-containing protein [Candidatus Odyssella thessalonicensis]|nr:folate-binding protein YgfZ [Candidatus Odyssella thessalonicensis]
MTLSACLLSHRALVRVTGNDKATFLQGLISNDVNKLSPEVALFALLLSPQGRYQFDLILHLEGEDWLLEVDAARALSLIKRLSVFRLRSNVTFEVVEDRAILAVWGEEVASCLSLEGGLGETQATSWGTAVLDPRLIALGARLIIRSEDVEQICHQYGIKLCSVSDYRYHRYQLGIPEGGEEIEVDRAIPLEWGMDELNAIDWNKGCYMGQELTARTRYRGLVRKRIFPVYAPGITLEQPILAAETEVGHWIAKEQDWGLAMVRLNAIDAQLTCDGQVLTIICPSWMKLPENND